MATNPIDFEALAFELLASEYKGACTLIQHMNVFITQLTELQTMFCQLLDERGLDTAIGAQLDILGEIVGQDRILINKSLIDFFGFTGGANLGYGSVSDPALGGPYATVAQINEPTRIELTDAQYRLLIKATIIKNTMRSTPEDLIRMIQFLFDVEEVQVQEGTQQVTIMIGTILTVFDKILILLEIDKRQRGSPSYFIPRTLCVNYLFGEYDPATVFRYGSLANPGEFPTNGYNVGQYASFF